MLDDVTQASSNLFITFGCGPSQGVKSKSDLVVKYLETLNKSIDKNGGVLRIPESLEFFKAESVAKSCERREFK